MDRDINPERLAELERNFLEARENAILNKIKALTNFQRFVADFGFREEDILGDEGAVRTYVLQYLDTEEKNGPKGPNGKIDWEMIFNNLNEIFSHVHRMLSKIKTLPIDTIPLCFNNEREKMEQRVETEIRETAFETTEEKLFQDYSSIINSLPVQVLLQNLRAAQKLLTTLLEVPAIRSELDERVSVYRKIEGDSSLGPRERDLTGISLAATAAALRERFKNVLH